MGWNTSLKVMLIYMAVGFAWIFLSDLVVVAISGETSLAARLQSIKGSLFIVVTGTALYLITAWYVRRILRYEHALIASETNYRALLDQASDGIFIFDHDGRVTAVNAQACEMLAYSDEELQDLNLAGLIVCEGALPHPFELPRLHAGETILGECHVLRSDGSALPVEINAKMLEDGRIQAIARDITQRKRSQEELDRRTVDLAERVQHVNCLYSIARLLRPEADGVDKTLQALVSMAAPAWRFPESARVRLILDDSVYESAPFDELVCRLTSEIVTRGQHRGWLEVGYTKPDPCPPGVCFTEAERELLDGIATHVMEFLEYAQTQEDLRAITDRLQAVFEATPLAVIVLDEEAKITTWNPAAEQIFGWKVDEVIGRRYPLVEDEDMDAFMAHFHGTLMKGFHRSEAQRRRKDGTRLQVNVSSAPLRNAAGQKMGIVGVLEDVTQQRQIERRFSALVQRSTDVIGIVDKDGVVRYVSPAVEGVLGYKPEDVIGQPAVSFLYGEDALEAHRSFHEVVENPLVSAATVTYRARHANGSWVTLESVLSDEASDILGGLVVNSRDVTDRKRMEDQIRRSQKMEAIGRLAGGIAHDFNNLLMAIGGYAEMLLLSVPKDSSQQGDVLEIISVVDRGASLVRQLLTFSRRKEPKLDELDLNSTIASLVRLLERTLGSDIVLETSLSEGLPPIHADMSQMEQIIINLAVNARDAIPKGGAISIKTGIALFDSSHPSVQGGRAPGRYVKLTVSDTGVGMTEEVRSRIFEPFFTTKQEGQGTGLGLATVYSIVEDHRGIIQVNSEPGHGTTFHIFLPAPSHDLEWDISPETTHGKPGGLLLGNETLLLLEDDPLLRKMTCEALEAFGYRVLVAEDAGDAVELIRGSENAVDLLLADVVLPGASGPDIYEQIKTHAPSLRVLFISGYTRSIVEARGLPPDAPLLQKPFSLTSLTTAVREALNGERRQEQEGQPGT